MSYLPSVFKHKLVCRHENSKKEVKMSNLNQKLTANCDIRSKKLTKFYDPITLLTKSSFPPLDAFKVRMLVYDLHLRREST